jgi:3-hydroxyacyl-[acyl-carrier-protein] dehydratase
MEFLDLPRVLPHRPPILMLDRVVEITPGVSGVGERTFRDGDACFEGHFPGRPVLPGVLTIEALAQAALAVLLAEHAALLEAPGPALPLGYLARVEEMSFQRPIGPGEAIRFAVAVERRLGPFTIVSGRVTRDGVLCAKGKLAVFIDGKALAAALEARRGNASAPTGGQAG